MGYIFDNRHGRVLNVELNIKLLRFDTYDIRRYEEAAPNFGEPIFYIARVAKI